MELGTARRGQAVSPPTVGDIIIYLAQEPVDSARLPFARRP